MRRKYNNSWIIRTIAVYFMILSIFGYIAPQGDIDSQLDEQFN